MRGHVPTRKSASARVGRNKRLQQKWRTLLGAAMATLAPIITGPREARAADLYWDANGTTAGAGGATPTGTWGVNNFWATFIGGAGPTGAWVSGQRAIFAAGTDATGAYTVTVSGTQAISGVLFEEGSVTLAGGSLSWTGSVGTYSVLPSVATINSVLTSTGALLKNGAGTLILGGVNTYSGGTTISEGTLQIEHGLAVGGGNITLNGGRLLHNYTDPFAHLGRTLTLSTASQIGVTAGNQINFWGTLNGGGNALTVNGGGLLFLGEPGSTLSNVSSIIVDGNTSLGCEGNAAGWGGTAGVPGTGALMDVRTGSSLGILNVNMPNPIVLQPTSGGNVALFAYSPGSTYSGPVTLAGTSAIGGDGSDFAITGNIAGTGGLTKLGASIVTLSGNNTYGGATTVSGGTLVAAGAASVPSGNDVMVQSGAALSAPAGATISLSGTGIVTTGAALNVLGGSFGGSIGGGGSFNKTGAGTFTLTGTNSLSASTSISGGTLLINSMAPLAGNMPSLSGGTLLHNFTDTLAYSGKTLTMSAGSGIGVTSGNQMNFWGKINGGGNGLTITGGGTFFLGESGSTVTNVGSISVTGNTILGSDSNAAGWGGTPSVPGSGPTVTVGDGSSLGALGTVMPNPLVLNGSAGGALFVYSAGAGFSGPITVNGIAGVGGSNGFDITGNISGTGGLVKIGPAERITLSGTNTYSGGTTVASNTLVISNAASLPSGGAVTIGNLGLLAALDVVNGATISLFQSAAVPGSVLNRVSLNLESGNYSGTIYGAGTLNKTGPGSMTLSGTNTYSGGTTTVNAGTLVTSNYYSIPVSGVSVHLVTVQSGATLDLRAGGVMVLSGTGNVILGGELDLAAGSSFGGVISGTSNVTRLGTGSATLSGANTYSGGTIFSPITPPNTLQIDHVQALGTGNVSLRGNLLHNFSSSFAHLNRTLTLTSSPCTLGVTGSNQVNFWGTLIGGGNGLVVNGSGTFFLGEPGSTVTNVGSISVSGNTTLGSEGNGAGWGGTAGLPGTGPTVSVENGSSLGILGVTMPNPIVLNGTTSGNGAMYAYSSSAGFSGPITLSATSAVGGVNNFALSGNITGPGGLTKLGSSTITLSGSNTYSGGTTISAGTLLASSAVSLPSGNVVTMQSGATLSIPGGAFIGLSGTGSVITGGSSLNLSVASNLTFNGSISGSGSLIKSGAGTQSLAGANTYAGSTIINAGTLRLGASSALPASTSVLLANVSGAAFDLNGNNATIAGLTGGGASGGNVTLGGGALTVDQPSSSLFDGVISGSGSLAKSGIGILNLTASNTYSGGTTFNGGTIVVSADAGLGSTTAALTFNGGTLQLNAGFSLSSSRAITLGTGGGTINTNGFNTTISQAIGGTGALTKAGAGTLTLTSAYSHSAAGTTISAGTLKPLGAFASATLSNSGMFESSNPVTFSGGSTNNSGAQINMTGSSLTLGSGVSRLANSGQINLTSCLVNGEIGSVAGSINTSGNVTFTGNITGGGGLLSVNSGITKLSANGNKVLAVNSLAVNGALDLTDNDLVVNSGNFSSIKALVSQGFGNTTAGITSSTSNGSQILALFNNALLPTPLTSWNGVPISGSAVVGKYTYFGDVNIDGQVTGDDYTVVDSNLNTDPAVGLEWVRGDANTDGIVTGDDYTVIDARLGLGVGNPLVPASLSIVPEPAGIGLAAIAVGLSVRRRRR